MYRAPRSSNSIARSDNIHVADALSRPITHTQQYALLTVTVTCHTCARPFSKVLDTWMAHKTATTKYNFTVSSVQAQSKKFSYMMINPPLLGRNNSCSVDGRHSAGQGIEPTENSRESLRTVRERSFAKTGISVFGCICLSMCCFCSASLLRLIHAFLSD